MPSSLYQENNLSYDKINRIFAQSKSMVNFAKNLMLELFDESELSQCHSVHGQSRLSSEFVRQGLDRHRIDLIRQIVEENAMASKTMWNECVNMMNAQLRKIKRRT